jgi:hypothetical protein
MDVRLLQGAASFALQERIVTQRARFNFERQNRSNRSTVDGLALLIDPGGHEARIVREVSSGGS